MAFFEVVEHAGILRAGEHVLIMCGLVDFGLPPKKESVSTNSLYHRSGTLQLRDPSLEFASSVSASASAPAPISQPSLRRLSSSCAPEEDFTKNLIA